MNGDKHTGKILDGRYELIRHVDEGGMGSVYLGRHIKIGRRAAVKFLHAALAGQEDVVTRFYREAQAASSIAHPNIIDIYDVGVAEWGEPYLVMEYLSGENLDSFLRRNGPISLAAACAIMEPALRALSAAHDRGIVHRDIKPENIFIVRQPDAPLTIKLIDFGISKFVEEDTLRLTRTGTLLGTPSYMSPEQARGKGTVDHRSDIYALGVILYRMLTGVLPFDGESYNDLIFTILTETYRDPGEVYDRFEVAARPIIDRLLQKDPDARYSDCMAVLAALSALSMYEDRHSALAELAADMPEDALATGALGGEVDPKQAVAETVLAGIAAQQAAETVVISSPGQEDDEWVMNSGHLPSKQRLSKRYPVWPYLVFFAFVSLGGLSFFARSIIGSDGDGEASRASLVKPQEKAERATDMDVAATLSAPREPGGRAAAEESRPAARAAASVAEERRGEALPRSPMDEPDTDASDVSLADGEGDPSGPSATQEAAPPAGGVSEEATAQDTSATSPPHRAGVPGQEGQAASERTGPAPKKAERPASKPRPVPSEAVDGEPPPEPEALPPAVVDGDGDQALTPADVNRMLAVKDRRIEQCYDMARIRQPDLQGAMVLRVAVSGQDIQATVVKNELNNTLAGCVLRAIHAILPPVNNGERVEIEKSYDFRVR